MLSLPGLDVLAVEPSTVKSHVRAILRKLGAVSRVEAITAASK